jgi:hypothetical protein
MLGEDHPEYIEELVESSTPDQWKDYHWLVGKIHKDDILKGEFVPRTYDWSIVEVDLTAIDPDDGWELKAWRDAEGPEIGG